MRTRCTHNIIGAFLKKVFISGLLTLCSLSAFAQVDTEFWFAAPDFSRWHDDRPIVLRLTGLDEPADVRITMPANPDFPTIRRTLGANEMASIDLTDYINEIESSPHGEVLQNGLKIESDNNITAYYEVVSNNSGIYSLKGTNALGQEFYVPMQNRLNNVLAHNEDIHDTWSSIEMVATEDNTEITITPTADVIHPDVEDDEFGDNNTPDRDQVLPAGEPITITLDEGETYTIEAVGPDADQHLGGTHIESNNDIAVNTTDDSIFMQATGTPWGSYDIAGDQLVPVSVLEENRTSAGNTQTEYIVMSGFLDDGEETAYVTATRDSTVIRRDGNVIAVADAGEQVAITLPEADPGDPEATYIETSYPSYVFQVTGYVQEIGGGLIPPISCTGSNKVGFVRSDDRRFFLNVLVPQGGEDDFILNGDPNAVNAAQFQQVPGSSGWMYAQIEFDESEIPVGEGNLLENTEENFHLGSISGDETGTGRYGYFSNFRGAEFLGQSRFLCQGDTITLDPGVNMDVVQWNTGDTTSSIEVSEDEIDQYGNMFWVRVRTPDGCETTDTIMINELATQPLDLDTNVICQGNGFNLKDSLGLTEAPNHEYVWEDSTYENGERVPKEGLDIYLSDSGWHYVTIYNEMCTINDSIYLDIRSTPDLFAGTPDTICATDSFTVEDAYVDSTSRVNWGWDDGLLGGRGEIINGNTIEPTFIPSANDSYEDPVLLILEAEGCEAKLDTTWVKVSNPIDVNVGRDYAPCEDETSLALDDPDMVFEHSTNGFNWGIASGNGDINNLSPQDTLNPTYTFDADDRNRGLVEIYLEGVPEDPCPVLSDSMRIELQPVPDMYAGPDDTICSSDSYFQVDTSSYSSVEPDSVGWITYNGTGNIYNPESKHPLYYPSDQDINNGYVDLVFRGVNCGTTVEDTMRLSFSDSLDVYAGMDYAPCEDESSIAIDDADIRLNNSTTGVNWAVAANNGDVGNISQGNTLNPSYTFDQDDRDRGMVQLYLAGTPESPCPAKSDTLSIDLQPVPDMYAGPDDTICNSQPLYSIDTSHYEDVDADSIRWYTSNGSGTFDDPGSALPVYNPSDADRASDYVDLIFEGDNCGPPRTDTMRLAFSDSVAVFTPDTLAVCDDEQDIQLQNDSTNGNETGIAWEVLNGDAANLQNMNSLHPTYEFDGADKSRGNVSLKITAEAAYKCPSKSDSSWIKIIQKPRFALSNTEICSDSLLVLNNSHVTYTASTIDSVSWQIIQGNGSLMDAGDLYASYEPVPADENVDSVLLQFTAYGCAQRNDTLGIAINDLPEPDLGPDDTICPGENITFGPNAYASYLWSTGANTQNITVSDAGAYEVEVTDNNSCVGSDDKHIYVSSIPDPIAGNEAYMCPEEDEYPQITADTTGLSSYTWLFNNTPLSGQNGASIQPQNSGYYVLTAENNAGCPLRDSIEITEACGPEIYVPDIFTPNGDGTNDYLELFGKNIVDVEFKIFNRWGEIIFVGHSMDDKWDGEYRGKDAPVGSYVWKLEYVGQGAEGQVSDTRYGEVTLTR